MKVECRIYKDFYTLGIEPGQPQFYQNIRCTKEYSLGNFNLAAYWKRKYFLGLSQFLWDKILDLDYLPDKDEAKF